MGAGAGSGARDFDVIVIGSGVGGLTAAVCLAQSGQRVLVVEQHYLPGGWCQSFKLGGYRFSPGVHYVGQLQPGGEMRQLVDGLGLSDDLHFHELNPDGYDHILVAGERFDIPRGQERFAARLGDRFPAERAGVRRYLEAVRRIAHEIRHLEDPGAGGGLLGLLSLPWRAPTLARWGLRSARALVESHVRDPLCRAVLVAQAGDHGMPPSLAPAPVHASVVNHYLDGAWYPRGGGVGIARALVRALERAGGELRLRTPVAQILVEDRRAIGVRLGDGTELRARDVVSNADPQVTFGRLVDDKHLGRGLRRRLRRTRWSVSALSLFCATDLDLRAAGIDSGNYWYYRHADVDAIYRQGLTAWTPDAGIPGFFLTCTTIKDPTPRARPHHTLEAFTFIGYEAFRAWAASRVGDRPTAYAALKRELLERMLLAAERVIPGLRDHVVFAELGTPLTNEHYVAATEGNLYGTEKRLSQIGPWAYPVRTEIAGLRLCGASTLSHGVLGAASSGVAAARDLLECRTDELLRAREAAPSLAQPPAVTVP